MGYRVQHGQIIMNGRAAFRATFRVTEVQNMHDFLRCGKSLRTDFRDDFIPIECRAWAYALFACGLKAIAQYALGICSTTGLRPPHERVAPVQALISSTVV